MFLLIAQTPWLDLVSSFILSSKKSKPIKTTSVGNDLNSIVQKLSEHCHGLARSWKTVGLLL
jgi:hypothetical protein